MLLTRSPLSTGRSQLLVRLACIRHAASVYPEPGSNSPTIIKASPTSWRTTRRNEARCRETAHPSITAHHGRRACARSARSEAAPTGSTGNPVSASVCYPVVNVRCRHGGRRQSILPSDGRTVNHRPAGICRVISYDVAGLTSDRRGSDAHSRSRGLWNAGRGRRPPHAPHRHEARASHHDVSIVR